MAEETKIAVEEQGGPVVSSPPPVYNNVLSAQEHSGPVISTSSGRPGPLEAPPAYGGPVTNAPPTYTNDAPPAYDDIFGAVRKARDESDGHVDYACKVFGMICCSTIVSIIGIFLCLAIPVASIVIGAMNLKNCTIEKYIPIYLIVAGVFGVIKAIVNIISGCINRKKESDDDDENNPKKKANPVDQLINCFLAVWFIAGSVWVYRIHGDVDYDDMTSQFFCDKTTYLFTFWIITVSYIFMALGMLCVCGMCCLMCCVAAKGE